MMLRFGDFGAHPRDIRNLVALMTSNKKIAANRANAENSTGPKTESGKSKSRLNATKHGAYALQRVIYGESEEEYQELSNNILAETAPQTEIECAIVDQIIGDIWRLRRIERAELEYFENVRVSALVRTVAPRSEKEKGELQKIFEEELSVHIARHAAQSETNQPSSSGVEGDAPHEAQKEGQNVPPTEADTLSAAKLRLQYDFASNLGKVLLEGMTTPDKQFPYTTLDQIRRTLVREIVRKYASLTEFQERRVTITVTSGDQT